MSYELFLLQKKSKKEVKKVVDELESLLENIEEKDAKSVKAPNSWLHFKALNSPVEPAPSITDQKMFHSMSLQFLWVKHW